MARKGTTKVRTGCITCKIRKIKCDEGRPACVKCTSTGRRCDGYQQPLPTQLDVIPWQSIPIAPSVFVRDSETRSLDFFHHVAGPAISSQLDSFFWTKLVLQAGLEVPAIRHATVAISSLYEGFGLSSTKPNELAVRHYNKAIKDLMSTSDEQTVLLCCILFICIEALLGDVHRAIDHCGHGVMIFNSFLAKSRSGISQDGLLEIFCRLSILPFFFGSTPHNFPLLAGLQTPDSPITRSAPTVPQLQRSLDILVCRAIRLVRNADQYRLGTCHSAEIPGRLIVEQSELQYLLSQWERAFANMESAAIVPSEETLGHIAMEMKHLIAKIWASNAFASDESAYDAHLGDFQRVVTLASHVRAHRSAQVRLEPSKFSFEMGFTPLLYFVVIKCRSLETRVEALRLMTELAIRRESLWDADVMRAVGRRIVELEHGISLDEMEGGEEASNIPGSPVRIMDSLTDPNSSASARRVTFFLAVDGGGVRVMREWVII